MDIIDPHNIKQELTQTPVQRSVLLQRDHENNYLTYAGSMDNMENIDEATKSPACNHVDFNNAHLSRSNSPIVDENDGLTKINGKTVDPKVCGVCGDKALGNNFNAITCESCKAFFRRNALKPKEFVCPFNGNCKVDPVTRRFCQKCRLKKCFDIGMKKEWIMTTEEKLMKKQKIEQNRLKRQSSDQQLLPSSIGLEPPPPKTQCLSFQSDSPPELSQTQHHSQQQHLQQYHANGNENLDLSPTSSNNSSDMNLMMGVGVTSSANSPMSQTQAQQHSTVPLLKSEIIDSQPSTPGVEETNLVLAAMVPPPQYHHHHHHHNQFTNQNASRIQQPQWHSHPSPSPYGYGNSSSSDCSSSTPSPPSHFGLQPQQQQAQQVQSIGSNFHKQMHYMNSQIQHSQNQNSNCNRSQMPLLTSLMRPNPESPESPQESGLIDCSARYRSSIASSAQSSSYRGEPYHHNPPPLVTDQQNPSPSQHFNIREAYEPQSTGQGGSCQNDELPIPLPLNTMDSILSVAITAEFNAFGVLGGRPHDPLSKELNGAELAKLNELLLACQALNAPVDEEGPIKMNKTSDPSLLNVINLTDIAIRRLIKMSKKISGFKNLCQEDQIALLKGSCTEMMILRSVVSYDPDRDSWNIPHSFGYNIKLGVLKEARGNLYEEHQRFVKSFRPEWRSDENIMIILCAITLFTAERPNVVHQDVIKLEQDSYYYLLKRYLESSYNGCEARSTYLQLIRKIAELHVLNSNHLRVFLEVNPREVEPLLIEIFDLK